MPRAVGRRATFHDVLPRAARRRPSVFLFLSALIGTTAVIPRAISAPSSTPSRTQAAETAPDQRQSAAPEATQRPPAPVGIEIVQVGGYPELHVDGKPFFIHSAAFFYDRIPRDTWESTLDLYRRTGINTLDIYIPWNWHEPKEGEFDFDGHTNPRRDLRALLSLIAQKGFRLIARPGPEILNEWRHGGYPGWLLDRPEYKMNPLDWIEGRYAPLDNLNARNAEAAAQGWLDTATHMQQAALWMAAVGKELAPFSSHRIIQVEQQAPGGEPAHEISGPLLFVQVGDDFAIERTNYAGPAFWHYVEDLAGMLKAGGLDLPVFINPTDMRVSAAGSALDPPIGAMGQWYMHPHPPSAAGPPLLTPRDASEIEFFTEELKTQPNFPPVMIEYQAGWYTPADDDRPLPDPPSNTLLSSRLLIANGIHGFNYFPLQDTYTPAGYSVPWANRSYRWDAALNPDGDPQPRMQAVERNAQFLDLWGPLLAASHKRADFGILYPLGAYPQQLLKPEDILNVSESVMRIERLVELSLSSSELLDPEYQPVEQLLRDPLLLLPVFASAQPQFQLSERAQQEIVDYVRRGGTLLVFPARPAGKIIGELWNNAPPLAAPSPDTAIRAKWRFGDGEVIESSSDFYSWISLDNSFAENRRDARFAWAGTALQGFLSAAGVQTALKFSAPARDAGGLIASEIVTDDGTGLLGKRTAGKGFLSVTNISGFTPVHTKIEILPPFLSSRSLHSEYSSMDITVPPSTSLLFPLAIPLCATNAPGQYCDSSLPEAGAEFLGARRKEKKLDLAFCVPARAEVNLHLKQKPVHIWLDETDTHPDSTWTPASHELHLAMPKGAAPDFRRTLRLEMPGVKSFKESSNPPRRASLADLDVLVANAVALPTSADAFLRTFPALVVPDIDKKMNVLLLAENRNENASGRVDLSFSRPLHGDKVIFVAKGGTSSDTLQFRRQDLDAGGIASPADHLFHTVIQVRLGGDHRVLPLVFLLHSPGAQEHYRFDFDRDGADEWVLENDRLRLIVSPESGGRAIALTDKLSGQNLSTSVGLLRDNFSFTENPPGISAARRRGRYGLSNRPYVAEWGGDAQNPVLKLDYHAPDVFPAGAEIEKSVRLDGDAALRADYQVALSARAATDAAAASRPQSFVAVNSFPAQAQRDSPTRFCWQNKPPEKAVAAKPAGADSETCRNFVRDAAAIVVPLGISKVQIRTPGRPEIELAWDCTKRCGQMTIEPKYFSALFRLQFPPLIPGAAAADYSLRIRVLNAP
jgi:Glycosyl hydrolases family 35